MGGRGSFVNVNTGNFAFVDGGQTYFDIGTIGDNIKILERPGKSVKAPEVSHTENRVYAIVQKGELKHIAFYDKNHNQVKSIDFMHEHGWNHEKPHVHFNLQHIKNEAGTRPSKNDWEIINQVNSWLKKNK